MKWDKGKKKKGLPELTSNSMGLLICGPHVKISFWNVQMPLLDVKEKVFSVRYSVLEYNFP